MPWDKSISPPSPADPPRWWWLLATLTALPSPSLSPGCATCSLAPLWVAERRTTTLLLPPRLPLHLSNPRRSRVKALARGRPRKQSRTQNSTCEGGEKVFLSTNCIWPPLMVKTWRGFPFLAGERGSLMFTKWGPFYSSNMVLSAYYIVWGLCK